MTQVDILLGRCSREYDLRIGNTAIYDVVLDRQIYRDDVFVYELVDRQGVYGDELHPLISYLQESEINVLLESFLLNMAYLCVYDPESLGMLSEDTIFMLERGGGYNQSKLISNNIGINSTLYADPMDNTERLLLSITEYLSQYVDCIQSTISLEDGAIITPISFLRSNKSISHLTDTVTGILQKICVIVLNNCGLHWFTERIYEYDPKTLGEMDIDLPKIALSSSELKAYIAFYFKEEIIETALRCVIPDLIITAILPIVQQDEISLNFAVMENIMTQAQLEARNTLHLLCEEISARIMLYLQAESLHTQLSVAEIETVYAQSNVEGTSTFTIDMMIDDMHMYYGVAKYDSQLLKDIDGFTIYELGDEIPYDDSLGTNNE